MKFLYLTQHCHGPSRHRDFSNRRSETEDVFKCTNASQNMCSHVVKRVLQAKSHRSLAFIFSLNIILVYLSFLNLYTSDISPLSIPLLGYQSHLNQAFFLPTHSIYNGRSCFRSGRHRPATASSASSKITTSYLVTDPEPRQ